MDIDWLETDTSNLEEAMVFAESKLLDALIMRDSMESAIAQLTSCKYTRVVDGVELQCEATWSM